MSKDEVGFEEPILYRLAKLLTLVRLDATVLTFAIFDPTLVKLVLLFATVVIFDAFDARVDKPDVLARVEIALEIPARVVILLFCPATVLMLVIDPATKDILLSDTDIELPMPVP